MPGQRSLTGQKGERDRRQSPGKVGRLCINDSWIRHGLCTTLVFILVLSVKGREYLDDKTHSVGVPPATHAPLAHVSPSLSLVVGVTVHGKRGVQLIDNTQSRIRSLNPV